MVVQGDDGGTPNAATPQILPLLLTLTKKMYCEKEKAKNSQNDFFTTYVVRDTAVGVPRKVGGVDKKAWQAHDRLI